MNFDEWCDAVNRSLQSRGKGFTVSQLDPVLVEQAYMSGQSPVAFAQAAPVPVRSIVKRKNADPWLEAFEPNYAFLKFLRDFIRFWGLLAWGSSLFAFGNSVYLVRAGAELREAALYFIVSILVIGVSGALIFALAELLNVFVRMHLDIENIRDQM